MFGLGIIVPYQRSHTDTHTHSPILVTFNNKGQGSKSYIKT